MSGRRGARGWSPGGYKVDREWTDAKLIQVQLGMFQEVGLAAKGGSGTLQALMAGVSDAPKVPSGPYVELGQQLVRSLREVALAGVTSPLTGELLIDPDMFGWKIIGQQPTWADKTADTVKDGLDTLGINARDGGYDQQAIEALQRLAGGLKRQGAQ